MTKEKAIRLFESKFWEYLSDEEIAKFQLVEDRLCMPFEIFQNAIEKTLNRPVFTHEFGLNRESLMRELFDEKEPPTIEDIIEPYFLLFSLH